MSHRGYVVVHVPHASDHVPADVRQHFDIDDEDLQQELLSLTDWYTDDLFEIDAQHGIAVSFPVSRFVVDPERFVVDDEEPMAAHGMGVIYTHRSDGTPYRQRLTAEDRDELLQTYYWPHWNRVELEVDRALLEHNRCLIIDAHSFPSQPLPVHVDQYGSIPTPDICLGTDPFHTPSELIDVTKRAFEQEGLTVSIDTPFAGTIVPLKHLGHEQRVQSIMIEVNRRLYMDEQTGDQAESFTAIKATVQNAIESMTDWVKGR